MDAREAERLGREQYRAGRYFEAHESFEEAWRQLAGPDKLRLQGLTQLAAAFHKLQTIGPGSRGLRWLLERSREKLAGEPGIAQAIDRCLGELEAGRVPSPPAL